MARTLPAANPGLLTFALVVFGCGSASAEVVAIVCPSELRPCFAEWITHREADDRSFAFIDPADCRAGLQRFAKTNTESTEERVTLVLVGDGTGGGVASQVRPSRVVRRFGPETDIVTDHAIAELVGATRVGRLPFGDAVALERYLRRVIERDTASPTWDDARLQIAAGVGNFSPLIDAAIEGAAASVVQGLASPALDTRLTRYGSRGSVPPAHLSTSRGGVWVWMGHGLRDRLPGITPGRVATATQGADFAVLLACYAGDFSRPYDCVAEQLLKAEDGPLAVIAATRVSMPYGNARFGAELLSEHSNASRETTIGDLVSAARRNSTEETTVAELAALDSLARLMGPTGHKLRDERLDHASMYHLLGDPLLPVARFASMTIETPTQLDADQSLTVRGVAPISGRLRVEVLKRGKSSEVTQRDASPIRAGDHFAIRLPANAGWQHGRRVVRVGIRGEGQLAIAATEVARTQSRAQRVAARTEATPAK